MIGTVELTPEQTRAQDAIISLLKEEAGLVTLGGYAGTGKTTLIAHLVPILRTKGFNKIAFCSYTGKAKNVMEEKLEAQGVLNEGIDFCGTLHSLLYSARQELVDHGGGHKEVIVHFDEKNDNEDNVDLVVVDEASMVDEEIFADLEALNIPILAVGDHGQLPPVRSSFNLMANPMVRLETIHRQAKDNPIIRLAEAARKGVDIPIGTYGGKVIVTHDVGKFYTLNDPEDWLLLSGTNRKRSEMNRYVRRVLCRDPSRPEQGERIICLKNNRKARIMNGMLGTLHHLHEVDNHWFEVGVDMDAGFRFDGAIFRYQFGQERTMNKTVRQAMELDPREFGDLFDYGYCLTVHKAQGSEADKVCLFAEEGMRRMMVQNDGISSWRRWLYTGITRARRELLIIKGV